MGFCSFAKFSRLTPVECKSLQTFASLGNFPLCALWQLIDWQIFNTKQLRSTTRVVLFSRSSGCLNKKQFGSDMA